MIKVLVIGVAVASGGALLLSQASRPSVRVLAGQQGWQSLKIEGKGGNPLWVDARKAVFSLANSKNETPAGKKGCEQGRGAVNPYPLQFRSAPGARLTGGLFKGRVPQQSDWTATYCNSAAIRFSRSPDSLVEGVRIAAAWDGVRVSEASSGLRLRGSWLSAIRDDAIENDELTSLLIEDSLIDGAFQGLSLKPREGQRPPPGGQVRIRKLLLRLQAFPYRGEPRLGALIKAGEVIPPITIEDSIVAIDGHARTFPDYWHGGWQAIRGQRNLLLVLGGSSLPPHIPQPPPASGFKIVAGAKAAELWRTARLRWIACHPEVARLESDPPPRPANASCDSSRGSAAGF